MQPFVAALLGIAFSGLAVAQANQYFTIKVVDSRTGRGVPLVELKTTDETAYYTDSNGIVAFFEPGLMGQTVYFNIRSDGYEFAQDLLGIRGAALLVTNGGSAVLNIRRTGITERLYRVTGEGIYRDSVLVGAPVPLKQPLLNGQVMGQDSGLAIPWRGKIYWFWGDTARPSYPLGNFGSSGGTSEWPASGGLDPNVGVDLTYFVDASGFTRPMFPSQTFPGPGPKWMGGLKIVSGEGAEQRLVADYQRGGFDATETGVAIFNDKTNTFERLAQFDVHDTMLPACTGGQATRVQISGRDYYYQGTVPPLCRVPAEVARVKDPSGYEGFSPLMTGTRYAKDGSTLDRDTQGRLRYGWKANTPPLTPAQQRDLAEAGKMTAREGFFQIRDVDTDHSVQAGPGSVEWNAFRGRWVMIVKQDEGLANHGTVWFAEADTPLGPWVYAKQILRHEKYNFYNPVQHAFFDQDGGRVIFFEGTYSDFFSAGGPITPRYNYNQIMYRLDLADPRLALPAPVYRVRDGGPGWRYLLKEELDAQTAWPNVEAAAFFAIPPGYSHDGLIPIFAALDQHGTVLRTQPGADGNGAKPFFWALPMHPPAPPIAQGPAGEWSCTAKTATDSDSTSLTLDLRLDGNRVTSAGDSSDVEGTFKEGQLRFVLKAEDQSYALRAAVKAGTLEGTWENRTDAAEHGTLRCSRPAAPRQHTSPAVVPLYEYVNVADGSHFYSTSPSLPNPRLRRSEQPLGRVWRNPLSQLFLDAAARPHPVTAQETRSSDNKAR